MIIEQIYTGCLAQGAYYIESKGEVAIIDPLREVQSYIDRAEKSGTKIKYIFETHFHADFVSGHVTLAEKTEATIVYGPTATTKFDSHTAKDNEEFKVGNITLKLLHTPGHTMESSSYLLIDENGKTPYILIVGEQETNNGTVSVRKPGKIDLGEMTADDFIAQVVKEVNQNI